MRGVLGGTKKKPHPEPVEGRTSPIPIPLDEREPGSLIQEPTNAPTQTIRIDVHPENVGLTMPITPKRPRTPDSSYAWWRLAASLALSTIGGVGLWSAVVVLPTIQAEFAVGRAAPRFRSPRPWSASRPAAC